MAQLRYYYSEPSLTGRILAAGLAVPGGRDAIAVLGAFQVTRLDTVAGAACV
jgi:hypothetical protein